MRTLQFPKPTVLYPATPLSGAAVYTGVTQQLPIADSYRIIVDVTAIGGTSPTVDVALQDSPDGGTTWYTFEKPTQITAVGQVSLLFAPIMALAQAATSTALATTGAAIAINQPFINKYTRVLVTLGGTTPTATVKVWAITQSVGQSID